MKVWVELRNGEEHTYENVTRIDEDRNKDQLNIYGDSGPLALINKSDIKNLLTEGMKEERSTSEIEDVKPPPTRSRMRPGFSQ